MLKYLGSGCPRIAANRQLHHFARKNKKKSFIFTHLLIIIYFYRQQRNYFSCMEPFDIKNIVNSYNGVSNAVKRKYTNFKCTYSDLVVYIWHLMKVFFPSVDAKERHVQSYGRTGCAVQLH